MILKLLSIQIPKVWEVLKFAATQADEVDQQELQPYLNELLHALLSDKAQCFVRLDEKRTLLALMITRIKGNNRTGEKCLYLQCLYSFQFVDDSIWEKDMIFIRQFADKEKCSYISFDSRNKKIQEMGKMHGFKEVSRSFSIKIGGI